MTEDLQKVLEALKFDKRMAEWYMRRGLLTTEELKKHLESLPDLSAEAARFDLEEEEEEETGNGAAH